MIIFKEIEEKEKYEALKEAVMYIQKQLRFISYDPIRQELIADGNIDEDDIERLLEYGYKVILK